MISNIASARLAVPAKLDELYSDAQAIWDSEVDWFPGISTEFVSVLDYMNDKGKQASTAFTNIITSLAIKATFPEVDIRYHQEQIQDQTNVGAGFSFRTLSEKVTYPWLRDRQFEGAKSGWQTRTMERDDPYTLSYPHKIGGKGGVLKQNFLLVYDYVEARREDAAEALKYLLFLQIRKRHEQNVDLAIPRTDNINLIVGMFERHFFHKYSGNGASRLPVLALYAAYQLMMEQLKRYEGSILLPLGAHSAADSQSGALGDIEVEGHDGNIFEVLELKHNIRIDGKIMVAVEDKVSRQSVKRYYVLTTHSDCAADEAAQKRVARIESIYQCVVICNGVLSSLRYYLRLLENPSAIFEKYIVLLNAEVAIGHEHRVAWNTVVGSTSA